MPVWSLAAAELGSVLASGLAACTSGMDDFSMQVCLVGYAAGVGQTDFCRELGTASKPSRNLCQRCTSVASVTGGI